MTWPGIIASYRDRLSVTEATPVITLLEGNTPLIEAQRISAMVDREVYLKYDGANPTGSFKDRGMTMAVSKALESGAKAVACASTGNTSASAAAYAARAGLRAIVILPAGKIARGKLAQAVSHGAEIVAVDGNFDDALSLVLELTSTHDVALVNSINPFRIEGQQSAAWEITAALGDAPTVHALPVGNAGNITAYWAGYKWEHRAPRMWGFQAAGAAPLVTGEMFEKPETIATAIRIGNPASWDGAISARDESEGRIEAVTDEEILDAYRILAAQEGVFCEPASAASVAGILKFRDELPKGPVVCTLTGHGLKDPDTAAEGFSDLRAVPPHLDAVLEQLGW
ncbi:MAG: threonine synthase [Acidimicrobiia bacterium]|nr:threonine synthase [Acidimicrobiia bacterium]